MDYVFNGVALAGAPTAGGAFYLTLHTATPGVDGQTSNEVSTSGTGYAAKTLTAADFSAPTAAEPSVVTITSVQEYGPAAGSGFTASHYALWNHASNRAAANFLGSEAITGGSKTLVAGDYLRFAANSLVFNLA